MTKADPVTIVRILVLFFAFVSVAPGQQRSEYQSVETDSAHRVVILDPGIALGRPILLIPPPLERDSLLGGNFEQRVDLLSPLQTVLGTVELAGVAYLAYRHIKKYGFLR